LDIERKANGHHGWAKALAPDGVFKSYWPNGKKKRRELESRARTLATLEGMLESKGSDKTLRNTEHQK
jgi:hypothetical protein